MNRIVKNFIVNGVSSVGGQIIAFLTTAYYAGVLGKDIFGSITLAQQVLLYFSMTVLFGLQTLGIRIIANSRNKFEKNLSEIISFRLSIACIAFIIISIFCIFYRNSSNLGVILALFSITLFPTAMNTDWVFSGIQEMRYNAVFNIIKNVIPAIIVYVFLDDINSFKLVPLAVSAGLIAGIFYQYFILKSNYNYKFKFTLNKEVIVKYLSIGLPFLISGLLSMVNNNVDKLVLGFSRSEGELGVYQAAYTFISFLITVEALIFAPVFPVLIESFKKRELDRLGKICDNLARVIAAAIFPIVILGIIFSDDIILQFFGAEYKGAGLPLSILLIYIFFLYFREIFGYQLNAWNGEKNYLNAVLISAALNAVLCILFVPRYGYVSAAVITTATELINLIVMRHYSNKIFRVKVIGPAVRLILPVILLSISALLMKGMNLHFILSMIVSIVVYILGLFIFKAISVKELKQMMIREV